MKKHFYIILAFILTTGLFSIACEGPEGPVGPRGNQGEQGVTGEQGPPGDDGEDGNANIMYSEWQKLHWEGDVIDQLELSLFLPESKITEEFILDGGLVMVYLRQTRPDPVVYPLPAILSNGSLYLSYNVFDTYKDREPGISVFAESLDGEPFSNNTVKNLTEFFWVRYLLIPGGTSLAGKTGDQNMKWDEMDYETITNLFGIPE